MSSVRLSQLGEGLAAAIGGLRGEAAVVGSVNPPAEGCLDGACRAAGLKGPYYAGRDFPHGVVMMVDSPSAVGMDRILNVKAAYANCGGACIVADFGTAVSLSAADEAGRFIGGAIMPGVGLALDCLSKHTALLPRVDAALPDSPLGRSTPAALRSGCVFGALGGVKEVISRIGAALGKEFRVYYTGGDGALMESIAPAEWMHVPGLTIEGLRLAYEERG